jgi:hypothetical protein
LEYHVTVIDSQKKTVMICEDDRDLLKLFGQALKSRYNVILVGSGKVCIEKFLEEKSLGEQNTSVITRLQIRRYVW